VIIFTDTTIYVEDHVSRGVVVFMVSVGQARLVIMMFSS